MGGNDIMCCRLGRARVCAHGERRRPGKKKTKQNKKVYINGSRKCPSLAL